MLNHLRNTAHARRHAITLLLMAALLCAHWTGMAHRVAHAFLAQAIVADAGVKETGDKAGHSCLAFDAATLADGLDLPLFTPPALVSAAVLALWTAFNCWQAPFTPYFSSRAPPVQA
ncbi:hypothetical protein SAMN06265795_101420 [Noviherbaspirillum humi]|uniref:Uncharacterized protein n=1 Tax=Noviherbaspirillum humi TaxID=1688639 RepID=A0A239CEF4_9BURK|nr:hypothetical protein [Noviherbaspirillum humi]SNS18616.1 hypothetical protein SAMN06265795_101420 [Noviherbaspirillum humi]